MNTMARRMFDLVEPIGVIPYSADEPNEAMFALGFTNYWDTYFAGRAAPLGLPTAAVVDALFYNFAPVRWLATSRRCGAPRRLKQLSPLGKRVASRHCGASSVTTSPHRASPAPLSC
ncbi:MAG TPA: hypothetical protein VFU98_08330 [Microlunatus sp.]|nr:hypothetical protein [Microlunatus sp.]